MDSFSCATPKSHTTTKRTLTDTEDENCQAGSDNNPLHAFTPSASFGSASSEISSSTSSSRSYSILEDIGVAFKNVPGLSSHEKRALLEKPWKPNDDPHFSYPYTERKDRGKMTKRHLGLHHLTGNFKCFDYSRTEKGIFCTPCVLFGGREAGGIKLKYLVSSPLQNFSRLTGNDGYLTEHLNKYYHQQAVLKSFDFLKTQETGNDVSTMVKTAHSREIAENRTALTRIILAIEHHGRLGLPLRGHRDSGAITLADTINYDQGNFRAVLQLMCECGDSELKKHLEKHKQGKGHYISPRSQNELINCIGDVMIDTVVSEVKKAKYYSILADETTDISGQEQLSLCVRYVNSDFSVQERFILFEIVSDLTGKGLAETILRLLDHVNLNIDDIVGQGYDGASAMSGNKSGVQKYICDKVPMATYVHCANHTLNLCLEKAGQIPEIQSCISTMKEIIVFFRESPKRSKYLALIVEELSEDDESSTSRKNWRLKKMCPTRWVESQESTEFFASMFLPVKTACDRLSIGDFGPLVAGKCLGFLKQITTPSFLVSMHTLSLCLSTTRPLSVLLQKSDLDVYRAMQSIESCETAIQKYRDDNSFQEIFSAAQDDLGEEVEICIPRIVSRMTKRSNPPSNSAYEYYKRAIFLPYVDTIIHQLHDRFSHRKNVWEGLFCLVPSVIQQDNIDYAKIKNLAETYQSVIPGNEVEFMSEFKRWESI